MAAASGASPADETLRRGRILSSRLYFDVPRSKVPVAYSPDYDITFHGLEKQHPFDSSKWGRVCSFLVEAGLIQKDRIVEPLEASEDALLVVHSEPYLNNLNSSEKVARIVEVPALALLPISLVQQKLLYPFRKQEMVMKKTSAVMQGFTLWTCTTLEYILLIMRQGSTLIKRAAQKQKIIWRTSIRLSR